jgi:orotate phosphoribosyltransferase
MNGHFLLTKGDHSDTYIQKDSILHHHDVFTDIINIMRNEAYYYLSGFDVVTGPALAGVVFAAPVAVFLSSSLVYPEKIDGKMKFRRGHDKFIKGKKVLLIEDIITTGGSVVDTIKAIEECGGIPHGVIAIWNRSGWKHDTVPVISLIDKNVKSWKPSECKLCKEGIPCVRPK